MKGLLWKELRENASLVLIALVVLTAMLILGYRDSTSLSAVTAPIYDSRSVIMQPLLASSLLKEIAVFCAAFGAVLGWLQIFRERHRDLWAFLIHRPVSRTRILAGKAAAGLMLYVMIVGLPLLVLVIWVSVPGHVFAPFEWRMVRPVMGCFLAGIVYYLAGLLLALRQARWYASRLLPVGLALLATAVTIMFTPRWWIAPGAVLIGGAVLAAAVWGSFLTAGCYRGQPPLGKGALVFAVTAGSLVVVTVAVAFIGNALYRSGDYTASYYQITKDGTIYRWVHQSGQPVRYESLNGEQPTDPKTGRPLTPEQIGQRTSPGYTINLDTATLRRRARSTWDNTQYFQVWRANAREVWYYWMYDGCLVGFDLSSRRMIGALGPGGFTENPPASGRGFRPPDLDMLSQRQTLTTATGVYAVNVEERSVRPLYTCPPGESIGGASDVATNDGWVYTLASTMSSVVLLTPEGRTMWHVPREPLDPRYTDLRVLFLEATNQFAIWLGPSASANQTANVGGRGLPIHVAWLDAQRGEIRRTELPVLPAAHFSSSGQEYLFGSVWPPALSLAMGKLLLGPRDSHWLWIFSLAWAALCAIAGWWLGNRYAFTGPAKLGWAVFHLAFGIPGFLAFLAVQEWPTREPCPACHRRRVVDRTECEHCGAGFAPPPPTGTEIFEPLLAK